jgi:hypothetical protein
MGFKSEILHVPMTETGFNYSRNYELIPDTGLIDPSTNYNLHNLGAEKRGGTNIIQAATVMVRVMGGYDFRQSTGSQNMVYAKQNGSVYANNDSVVIATGMSISNFFSFSQFYDDLYIADGATTPKKWSGGGPAVNVTPASDWALTGNPFQIVFHPRGASFRNWAITRNGVYASKDNVGDDFADADVKYIPVYSKSGLVAAVEFGQELFVFSKTETFRIDDSDPNPLNWGYEKAIWEGGAAHWRLIVHADNDLYIMTDDLTFYSLQGVFQKGDYRKASVSRPAQIDRYLREVSIPTTNENWHCAYDPKIRAIKWFIQVAGTRTNTALVQFIDRPPDKMWAIHNNLTYSSGYTASASFTYRKTISDWRIRTGDYIGNIWELEQLARNDNNNPIFSVLKFKPWEFTNPVMHKRFNKGVLRVRSATNITLNIFVWVDNIRLGDINLTVSSSGAVFDVARFDIDRFADDQLSKTPFDLKTFGKLLQIQINHNTINEDFFFAEILVAFKEQGIRIYA